MNISLVSSFFFYYSVAKISIFKPKLMALSRNGEYRLFYDILQRNFLK